MIYNRRVCFLKSSEQLFARFLVTEVCSSFCLRIRIQMLTKQSRVFRRKQIRNKNQSRLNVLHDNLNYQEDKTPHPSHSTSMLQKEITLRQILPCLTVAVTFFASILFMLNHSFLKLMKKKNIRNRFKDVWNTKTLFKMVINSFLKICTCLV